MSIEIAESFWLLDYLQKVLLKLKVERPVVRETQAADFSDRLSEGNAEM